MSPSQNSGLSPSRSRRVKQNRRRCLFCITPSCHASRLASGIFGLMSVSVPQSYSSFARSSEDRIPNIEAAAQVVPSIALFTLAYWNTLNKSSSGLPRLIHPSCCHLLQPSSAIPCAFLITRSSRPLTRNRPSLAGSPLATTVLLFAFSSLVLLVPHTCVSTCPLPSPLPPSPPTASLSALKLLAWLSWKC